MALRDTIRASQKPRRAVEVPGWGVTVYARTLSAAERLEWERRCDEKKKDGEGDTAFNVALMLVTALEDEGGLPVFSEENDLLWLQHEAGAPDVFTAYEAIADLNVLTKERREELRKNSGPAAPPAAASPSNSPAPATASST